MTAVRTAPAPRRLTRRFEAPGELAGRRSFLAEPARFSPPPLRAGTVQRTRLLERIEADGASSIVAVIAPPGYGKTTLLAQLAAEERVRGRVAWLRLNDLDNDPATLLGDVSMALGLTVSSASLPGDDVENLVRSLPARLRRLGGHTLLILDDVHRAAGRAALEVMQVLLDQRSAGLRIALAGRAEPDLPLARYRAEGDVLDMTCEALALDPAEATALVKAAGCPLKPADIRTLHARTEGWAAVMYLAVLALADGHDLTGRAARVSGADPFIAGYLRSEFEREVSDDELTLLMRTAVLDTVSAATTDAVSGIAGAGQRLNRFARTNQLVVGIDNTGEQVRYHTMLREYLLAELERREPDSIARVNRAATHWFQAVGQHDRAVHHARATGDVQLAAQVVARAAATCPGDTVDRWLARFDRTAFEQHPPLAAAAAWRHLLAGRRQPADDMADIIERISYPDAPSDGSASWASQQARLRGLMARNGHASVLEDAKLLVAEEGPGSPWQSSALWLLGEAHLLRGERAVGLAAFEDAIQLEPSPDPLAQPVARARLAMAKLDEGDWTAADALMREWRTEFVRRGYEANPGAVMVFVADARIAIVGGEVRRAGDDLGRANALWPRTSYTMPWLAFDALLHLVQANLSMSETRTAQAVLRHAEQIVHLRPDLGAPLARLQGVRTQLADASSTLVGGSVLTPAELRVVSLLPTHLSFQAIGDRLAISRNTVKTHAMSIYGKLWVSSRDEAVQRGVELGLLEPHPVLAGTAPHAGVPHVIHGDRPETEALHAASSVEVAAIDAAVSPSVLEIRPT